MAHLTSADYKEIPKRVIADLQELTAEKGNLFKIPPVSDDIIHWFILCNIQHSTQTFDSVTVFRIHCQIVLCVGRYWPNQWCPVLNNVSNHLLIDKLERTGGALNSFIFGPDKSNKDRIIDYGRVQLFSGFGDYTTSASGELLGKKSSRAVIIEGVKVL